MSVRFDASNEFYSATNGLPSGTALTVTCWMYLISNPAAQVGVWQYRNTAGHYLSLFLDPGPNLFGQSSNNVDFPTVEYSGISTATWYGVGISVSGANARLLRVTTPNGTPVTSTAADFVTPATWNTRYYGTKDGSTTAWFNGRLAAVKAWNAQLSQAELEAELTQYPAVRTSNLLSEHRLQIPETTDYSSNGSALSGGAGASTEADPPLPDPTPPVVDPLRLPIQTIQIP